MRLYKTKPMVSSVVRRLRLKVATCLRLTQEQLARHAAEQVARHAELRQEIARTARRARWRR